MELRSDPVNALDLAKQAHEEGRLEDARLQARQVVDADPNNVEALLMLGVIAAKQGRPKLAQMLLGQVIQADRQSFYGHYWLSLSLHRSGQVQEALGMAERAVSLNTSDAAAQNHLGICYRSLGQSQDALASFRRSVELDDSQAPALIGLADTLLDVMRLEEATAFAFRALELTPDVSRVRTLLVKILLARGRAAEAEEHAREAVRLSPGDASPHTLYGNVLEALGRFDEAARLYRDSVVVEPRQGFSYFALARLGAIDPTTIGRMKDLRREARMPKRDLAYLDYALGKAFEDGGEYQAAMSSYDQANLLTRDIKFGSALFAPEPYEESLGFACENWGAEFLATTKGLGLEDGTPVFVVGMMRSGTTLAEQILSCHPEIGASGEQLFWPSRYAEASNRLPALATEYLELLRSHAPSKARVVDKMPDNYKLLGLLHAAFPNARFIHMTRNPIDTCLSIWTTPNQGRLDWAHDKANIAFAYKQYLSFMAHWRSVLPPGRMLEVGYEELVQDREAVTRRMIEFCGLEWDEACLSPENNPRSIATPSVWQVRQPVYGSSVDRWRHFEPWLGEFASLPAVEAASLAGEGQALLQNGHIEQANRLFERSIEINPQQGYAYFALAYSRRIIAPGFIEQMEKLQGLTNSDQIDIAYALGKANEDLGNFESAMRHFDAAHHLVERGAPLDEVAYETSLDFTIRNFDTGFLSSNAGKGSLDETPIFVVGMIRSGTTLVEQILSCHPEIGSAGEQPFWSDHRTEALLPPGNVVDPDRMRALTDEYSRLLPPFKRVVDKMPNNYLHLGILRAAFPNARLIHMRRNPVDTCLSIWKTPNQARLDWCHRKSEIVFTYQCYLRLMEHWRSVLAGDLFLEIQYEDLVSDQDSVARKMVEFCGLEWNDACLRPESNVRPVMTPSAWQVRQPLYSSSVDKWRKYEPWLGEFAELK